MSTQPTAPEIRRSNLIRKLAMLCEADSLPIKESYDLIAASEAAAVEALRIEIDRLKNGTVAQFREAYAKELTQECVALKARAEAAEVFLAASQQECAELRKALKKSEDVSAGRLSVLNEKAEELRVTWIKKEQANSALAASRERERVLRWLLEEYEAALYDGPENCAYSLYESISAKVKAALAQTAQIPTDATSAQSKHKQ